MHRPIWAKVYSLLITYTRNLSLWQLCSLLYFIFCVVYWDLKKNVEDLLFSDVSYALIFNYEVLGISCYIVGHISETIRISWTLLCCWNLGQVYLCMWSSNICFTEYNKWLVHATSKQQVCYAWQVSDLFTQTCFIKHHLAGAT